jgi:hypothetical protein
VLGARGALSQTADEVYDEQRIDDRSAVLQVAIDARQQAFPEEKPYTYQAFTGREERFRWNPTTRDAVIRDYNLKDLSI